MIRACLLGMVLVVACLTQASRLVAQGSRDVRTLSRSAFEDKIRGGWAGQMIGVSFGAPTEFTSNGRIIEGELPPWTPARIENAITQDDLYVEMTFAAVMDRIGLEATTEQYGEAFRTSKYELWHANAGARRLLARGVPAPRSGDPKHNAHANDIDFQIESDFIGLMTPGLPREAAKYCARVGRVMNAGDGLYGGYFVTGMYAAAFFERDPRRVVELGLAMLPAGSRYARVIRDVLAWSQRYPADWKRTWQLIEEKWDKDDPCPDGALQPFNIDASLNGAYIALGLLYGGGDVAQTLDVATRAGQDSDCNPSNAIGILGVMLGYDAIPARWKSGIPAIANQKFEYTDYSFEDIVRSTITRAETVVRTAGGRVDSRHLSIPVQTAVPPALEQVDFGKPDRRIPVTDSAWELSAGWAAPLAGMDGRPRNGRVTTTAGAQATLTFSGTAVVLLGDLVRDGGKARVFLDGAPAGEVDAYIPPDTHDNVLWHVFGLAPGTHTVRIETIADRNPASSGRAVSLSGAVVYR